jgi:hypothetical protein
MKDSYTHRLRYCVDSESPTISNDELNEVIEKIPYDEYNEDYECSGNFILTKDQAVRDERVTNMCCGIITEDIKLASGEMIYFAFDYGH